MKPHSPYLPPTHPANAATLRKTRPAERKDRAERITITELLRELFALLHEYEIELEAADREVDEQRCALCRHRRVLRETDPEMDALRKSLDDDDLPPSLRLDPNSPPPPTSWRLCRLCAAALANNVFRSAMICYGDDPDNRYYSTKFRKPLPRTSKKGNRHAAPST